MTTPSWLMTEDGCDIAPHCLECPLVACRFDLPPNQAAQLARLPRVQALLKDGLSTAEIAKELRVSVRTIWRARDLLRNREDS